MALRDKLTSARNPAMYACDSIDKTKVLYLPHWSFRDTKEQRHWKLSLTITGIKDHIFGEQILALHLDVHSSDANTSISYIAHHLLWNRIENQL